MLLAGSLAACAGGTHGAGHIPTGTTTTRAPTTAPVTTTAPAATTAPASSSTTTMTAAPPSAQAIAAVIASTHEVSDPNEDFSEGSSPVTVSDGHGGYLTAVAAGRTPSADGHGWLVFFWHDQTFLGWDTDQETWNVSVEAGGPRAIVATYPDYAPTDPACCPSLAPVSISYSWSGATLAQSRQLPKGSLVGIAVERD